MERGTESASQAVVHKPIWAAVGVFLVTTTLHSAWLIWLQGALGIEMRLVSIVQLGPSLGLLTTWLLMRRQVAAILPGPPEDAARFSRRLAGAAAVIAAYAGLTFVLSAVGGTLNSGLYFTGGMLVLYLLLQLMGAFGEEMGWRGFLQPVLEARIGRFGAAAVVGTLWAAWHVDRLADPPLFIGFAVTSIGLSIALGYFCGGAWWQRGIVAGLIHWIVNVALFFFTDPMAMLQGEGSPLAFALPPLLLGVVVTIWLLTFGRSQRGGLKASN